LLPLLLSCAARDRPNAARRPHKPWESFRTAKQWALGSAGFQPAVSGILPGTTCHAQLARHRCSPHSSSPSPNPRNPRGYPHPPKIRLSPARQYNGHRGAQAPRLSTVAPRHRPAPSSRSSTPSTSMPKCPGQRPPHSIRTQRILHLLLALLNFSAQRMTAIDFQTRIDGTISRPSPPHTSRAERQKNPPSPAFARESRRNQPSPTEPGNYALFFRNIHLSFPLIFAGDLFEFRHVGKRLISQRHNRIGLSQDRTGTRSCVRQTSQNARHHPADAV
jgi:hypothetical protein